MLLPLLSLILAFLLGSFPTALVLGKLKGVDIRKHGSGNIGATNAFRVLGKAIGIFCLAIDIAKGWAPAYFFSPPAWIEIAFRPESLTRPTWGLLVGLTAVAGHSLSPWVGFKGGKGVATSLGALLAVAPVPVLICFALGATIIGVTGYVSVASILGSALLPILIAALPPGGERPWTVIILSALLGGFVIWRHRSNIGRLLAGNENRISFRSDKGRAGSTEKGDST